ncbi:MAG: HAMP domain-containing histidine kinase [Desulfobulbaceae bacterium]|uniref:histidine kinase n=1 Tax=Candidatus Desulfobia pelagia TaxID=2841692 RepID=A0A8J6TG22_9BACT|nr:HAMP domain-containing histidine kinase [Candidatus Desulfobia pelagia]
MNDTFPITPPPEQNTDASKIAFSWLLRLRWWAMLCLVLIVAVVALFYDIKIPLPLLFVILCFQAASNLYFMYRQKNEKSVSDLLFGVVMVWDALHLTVLLYFTGGPMNPFTFLYLVHVALGAMLMRPAWSWSLAVLTMAGYASIFFIPEPEILFSSGHDVFKNPICVDTPNMLLHLQGMWAAYTISAFFIVFFMGRIQKELVGHQQTLLKLEEEKIKSERLASLATLAAGAAHEFSTPLSTIAVVAGEMIYDLKSLENGRELLEDAQLIRTQVTKCRDILGQLNADAGEPLGEHYARISVQELLAGALGTFREETGRDATSVLETEDMSLYIPVETWTRTLKGLLKNSLDAGADSISLLCSQQNGNILFTVTDNGKGMDKDTLSRAREPFYTTKETGKGMGLGLFLAKSLAERFGGHLHLSSAPGLETKVSITVSIEKITG